MKTCPKCQLMRPSKIKQCTCRALKNNTGFSNLAKVSNVMISDLLEYSVDGDTITFGCVGVTMGGAKGGQEMMYYYKWSKNDLPDEMYECAFNVIREAVFSFKQYDVVLSLSSNLWDIGVVFDLCSPDYPPVIRMNKALKDMRDSVSDHKLPFFKVGLEV